MIGKFIKCSLCKDLYLILCICLHFRRCGPGSSNAACVLLCADKIMKGKHESH